MRRSRRDLILVGVFVLGAGGVLLAALAWIAGARVFRPVDTYTVVFDGSVSGLTPGAVVEFQGVTVGQVRDIQLTSEIPPQVAVVVDLEPGTPVRKDTRANLAGSLVTGIKFIQLEGGSQAAGRLPPRSEVQGSVTSLEQFQDRVTQIADRAIVILQRLDQEVFTSENNAKLNQFVADLSGVAANLRVTLDSFGREELGRDIARFARKASSAADRLDALVADVQQGQGAVVRRLTRTIDHVDVLVGKMETLVQRTGTQVSHSGGALAGLLEDMSAVTAQLSETLDVIRSDPSVLVRGREVPEREYDE